MDLDDFPFDWDRTKIATSGYCDIKLFLCPTCSGSIVYPVIGCKNEGKRHQTNWWLPSWTRTSERRPQMMEMAMPTRPQQHLLVYVRIHAIVWDDDNKPKQRAKRQQSIIVRRKGAWKFVESVANGVQSVACQDNGTTTLLEVLDNQINRLHLQETATFLLTLTGKDWRFVLKYPSWQKVPRDLVNVRILHVTRQVNRIS